VFHYDMIGYADQGPLDHRRGFSDPQAELWSENLMGLQTWNSIRALDFLASLPDVDASRIGVTGASGGGTQTFVLCAVDPRPAAAFPAVMVSTAMQGGCVCENASHLRIGLNNVAFAACFAPKPLAMSGANDWTIDIESKGLPELKQVWGLYGRSDDVAATCFPQFGHNYNEVSRGVMYQWFNRRLGLGLKEPIEERDFAPLTREELTVFTAEHPRPDDALDVESMRAVLTTASLDWYANLVERGRDHPDEYRQVIEPAARVLLGDAPDADDVVSQTLHEGELGVRKIERGWCGRRDGGEWIPWVRLTPASSSGDVTIWIDGRGKQALFTSDGQPIPAVQKLLDQGEVVVMADAYLTGEYAPSETVAALPVNRTFAGYTYGYNRPLIAERVRDILTLATATRKSPDTRTLHLVGSHAAGPWVLLARSRLGDQVARTQVDLRDFSFGALRRTDDPDFLPGALKFGGVGGLLAAAGPVTVEIVNAGEASRRELEPFTKLGGRIEKSSQRLTPNDD
jgi:hypothetical protein